MSYQNNTIEALKKLYAAMGGTAADVENLNITPEMISAIADIYQGGSSLPEVTGSDNGKLLTVVNGAWNKAIAQIPVIYPTYTYVEGWECDTTFADLYEWIASGRMAIARIRLSESQEAYIPMSGIEYAESTPVGVAFAIAAPASYSDVKHLTSIYIGHGAEGIIVETDAGYLSANDPNT